MAGPVHQFHQGIRRRDAVGEEMLALREILLEAGFDSSVYVAEEIPEELKDRVFPLSSYRGDPRALLLVHHSIGHRHAGLLGALPDRRVLVYHNVTPTRFFAGNPFMQRYLERGRRQLRTFAAMTAGAFADSRYNADELLRSGFLDVSVLPPVFGMPRLGDLGGGDGARHPVPLVLFTGRLARNKAQDDVLTAFEVFRARYAPQAELVLAGAADEGDPYVARLKERLARSPARDAVRLPGIVTDEELSALFRSAHLYLSMSEHEGFGVPLLEAFAAGVPVLAYDAGAVAETMGGAGIVFSRKDPEEVAALMAEVVFDRGLAGRVVVGQRERLKRPDIAGARDRFLAGVERWRPREGGVRRPRRERLSVRVEGPFETSYGLAVANRRLAEGLERHTPHRVSIHCTEGPGDYLPRQADLADKPLARRLWERSFTAAPPDVSIRNMYPPRFERGDARLQLAYFFWEDSLLPPGWAADFDATYDGFLAPSTWVRDVLRRSGVTRPAEVVPTVVEIGERERAIAPAALPTRKSVKLLSVGSAFPRKGTDVLIRAFARAFTAADDVALVVKTFPNPHNTVAAQLEELRAARADAPEVVHVDRDLPHDELIALYRASDALVHPARAEGFGLPPAEAMSLGIPVVATSATALADFCTEETCLVVPHLWERSGSHFGIEGSEWAEPDEEALAGLLRGLVSGRLRQEAERRAARGRQVVAELFSELSVARRAAEVIERLHAAVRPLSVAFASTWNVQCGIAAYTRDLAEEMSPGEARVSVLANEDARPLGADGPEVSRVWSQGGGSYDAVVDEALERGAEVVHLQFHPGLFAEYRAFGRAVASLAERGIRVVATVHLAEEVNFYGEKMTLGLLGAALSRCDSILVHNETDRSRLESLGLGEKVERIAVGSHAFPVRDRVALARDLGLEGRRVVATFGFALPHKGILEALEAVRLLERQFPSLLLLVLAARRAEAASVEYLDRCRRRIAELGVGERVVLIEKYLGEAELSVLLQAAEVVVLPYHATLETASAAVRYPLACGRATVTTRERIFDDVRPVVLRIPDPSPAAIARGVTRLLSDPEARTRLEEEAWAFSRERSWRKVARAHLDLYRRLTAVPRTAAPAT